MPRLNLVYDSFIIFTWLHLHNIAAQHAVTHFRQASHNCTTFVHNSPWHLLPLVQGSSGTRSHSLRAGAWQGTPSWPNSWPNFGRATSRVRCVEGGHSRCSRGRSMSQRLMPCTASCPCPRCAYAYERYLCDAVPTAVAVLLPSPEDVKATTIVAVLLFTRGFEGDHCCSSYCLLSSGV